MKKIICILSLLIIMIMVIMMYLNPTNIVLNEEDSVKMLLTITNFKELNKEFNYEYDFKNNILKKENELTMKKELYYLSKNIYQLKFFVSEKTLKKRKNGKIKFYLGYCNSVMPVLFLNNVRIKNKCDEELKNSRQNIKQILIEN